MDNPWTLHTAIRSIRLQAPKGAELDDLAKTTLSAEHIQRTNTMIVLDTVLEAHRIVVPDEADTKAER